MPKIKITERDLTGGVSLPSAEHAIYIPGLMQAGKTGTGPIFYSAKGSLVADTKTTGNPEGEKEYDTGCLSYKLATYLQDRLGMQIVYEGIAPSEITGGKIPEECWTRLRDNKDKFPVRFLTTGQWSGIDSNEISCAASRGDCIALVDLDESASQFNYDADTVRAAFQAANSEYAAGFTPAFITNSEALETSNKSATGQVIPASFGYLFAYARMIKTYPEWIATAGAVNGLIPELKQPLHYYSDADAQILQGRTSDPDDLDDIQAGVAVNPILEEYPFGIVIWGARTLNNNAAGELKALSFLNIRNLVTTLKKVLRKAARRFTFDQNSDVLWYNFKSMIEPTLESMKNGNGIAGYKIEQLATRAKARLKAKITIIPIEPVEDFDLEVELTDSITVNE